MKLGKYISLFSQVVLVGIPLSGCFPASAYSQDAEKTKLKAETGRKPATIKPLTQRGRSDSYVRCSSLLHQIDPRPRH